MAALLEPYQPLYLKHRPQTLGQLVGQRTVVKTLTNAIDNDRIAHAYLFTGPRGCGKTSSARILAKSLNCENGPTATPCMQCSTCEEIKKGISPAVMEIDAASNNSVDDARVLIERAPLVAQGGRFKLYIIDECHMLTKEAFNALLKTIEEPPPRVIFILATTEEHKVPPTIISRCQRLMFRLANHDELCAHLRSVADIEKIAIEDEAIELISRRSGGGLRDALGLLDQASLLATPEKPVAIKDLLTLLGAIEEDVLLSISEGIAARDAEKVLNAVHELLAQGREPSLVALELAKHFLNLAKGMHLSKPKASAGSGEQIETSLAQQLITGSQNYIQRVIAMSASFEGAELTQIVMELDRLEQTLRRSTQPSLALEVGLLSLCHRHDILLVKELAKKVEYLENAIAGGAMPLSDAAHAHNQSHGQGQAPQLPAQPAPTPRPAQTQHPVQNHREPDTLAVPPTRVPPKEHPQVNEDGDVEPQNTDNRPPADADDESSDNTEDHSLTASQPPSPASAGGNSGAIGGSGAISIVRSGAAGSDKSDLGTGEDLDEFWSNLLTDLQSRHLPSYSVISQFGFPVSVKHDELVIGVLKDNLQKLIENKSEQIKTSAKIISGRELFIKVRVAAADSPPPPPKSADGSAGRQQLPGPGSANRGQSQEKSTSPRPGVSEGDEEPGEPALVTQSSALRNLFPVENARGEGTQTEGRGVSPAVAQSGGSSKPSAADLSRPDQSSEGPISDNQLMVKEAYKLFEGPGSRRVG